MGRPPGSNPTHVLHVPSLSVLPVKAFLSSLVCRRSAYVIFLENWSIWAVLRASSLYALPVSTNCFLLWLNFLPGKENLLYLMIDEKQHLFMMRDEDMNSCLGKVSPFQLRRCDVIFKTESRSANIAMEFWDSIKLTGKSFQIQFYFHLFSAPEVNKLWMHICLKCLLNNVCSRSSSLLRLAGRRKPTENWGIIAECLGNCLFFSTFGRHPAKMNA